MSQEYLCSKKDKRLLVLLALGLLILLSDLMPLTNTESEKHTFSWLESQEENNKLHRFIATGQDHNSADNSTFSHLQTHILSSRTAFILGQPMPINSTKMEDLTIIPGIGPSLAANIISYRQQKGSITSPYQLEKISGIGPKTKQRIQYYFTYSTDDG